MRILALTVTVALVVAAGASAARTDGIGDCLEQTAIRHGVLRHVIDGLTLTREQKLGLRARIVVYEGRNRGGVPPIDLHGLGLTLAQTQEIKQNIAATYATIVAHPAGWPCKPFKNEAMVVDWVKAKLVENGFRPNVTVSVASDRQIWVKGIQDGIEIFGVVVRSDVDEITISLQSVNPRWGQTTAFALGFEA